MKLVKGLDSKSYKACLRDLSLNLKKKRFRGNLTSLFNYLKGDCGKVGVSSLSQVRSDRTRLNGLTLCLWRFIWDIRKNFSPRNVMNHWNGLLREAVKPPSLEAFERRVDRMLRD